MGFKLSEERRYALDHDLRFYEGCVHDKCGTTTKYSANCHCVACAREKSKARTRKKSYTPRLSATKAKQAAKDAGEVFYIGGECRNCGSRRKYVRNGNCYDCKRLKKPAAKQMSTIKW